MLFNLFVTIIALSLLRVLFSKYNIAVTEPEAVFYSDYIYLEFYY